MPKPDSPKGFELLHAVLQRLSPQEQAPQVVLKLLRRIVDNALVDLMAQAEAIRALEGVIAQYEGALASVVADPNGDSILDRHTVDTTFQLRVAEIVARLEKERKPGGDK
jgi:hypothetical protein